MEQAKEKDFYEEMDAKPLVEAVQSQTPELAVLPEMNKPRDDNKVVVTPAHQSAPARPAPMLARSDGTILPTTLEDGYRLAQYFYRSGLVPRALDSVEKVFIALQLLYELGLKPATSIKNVMVFNGVPSIFGDLPLALVRRSPSFKSFKEIPFDKELNEISRANKNLNADVYGYECVTERWISTHNGSNEWSTMTTTFTVDDAKRAQLWGKVSRDGKPSPWVLYPQRMLQFRSRAMNLKDHFGDVLGGVSILEYDNNAAMDGDEVVTTYEQEKGPSLAAKFLNQPPGDQL